VFAVPVLTAAPASAHDVLLATADAAGDQVDESAGAAYWHVVSEVDYPNTEPYRREIWLARSGASIMRDPLSEAQSAYAAGDVALDPSLVRTEALGTAFVVGGKVLSWKDLDALPTNADELGAVLREMVKGHASGDDNELWESVTGLLRESPASPALRRALWQVAATIPDVQLIGSATDSAGRPGKAIVRDELNEGWYRVVYIVDPSDGTLLETQNIDAQGTVAYRATELEQDASSTAPTPQTPICGPGSRPSRSC
jgi:hypothetical protein